MKTPKFKQWELILLTWVDSMHTSKWRSSDDAIKDCSDDDYLIHKTIGFFLTDTPGAVTLVQSVGKEFEYDKNIRNVDACMTIPKVAIIKVRKINAKV